MAKSILKHAVSTFRNRRTPCDAQDRPRIFKRLRYSSQKLNKGGNKVNEVYRVPLHDFPETPRCFHTEFGEHDDRYAAFHSEQVSNPQCTQPSRAEYMADAVGHGIE